MLIGALTDWAAARLSSQAASFQVKSIDPPHHRGGLRPQLGAGAERVGLERQQRAIGAAQLVLVEHALAETGDEDLPDPDPGAAAHRVAPAVPAVEVADHRDPGGIRRPDREMHAGHAGMLDRMRAQPLPQAPVRALADQVVVEVAQHRRIAVGVVDFPGAAGVAARARCSRTRPADPPAGPRTARPRGAAPASPTTAPVASSTTSSRAAPGTNARITTPPAASCGPSTANGSSCRASTRAATVSAASR